MDGEVTLSLLRLLRTLLFLVMRFLPKLTECEEVPGRADQTWLVLGRLARSKRKRQRLYVVSSKTYSWTYSKCLRADLLELSGHCLDHVSCPVLKDCSHNQQLVLGTTSVSIWLFDQNLTGGGC